MIICEMCESTEVKVISSDPFGDEAVVQCIKCGEVFDVDKDDLANEHFEDQPD